MSDRSAQAPLFVDALALSRSLVERFGASAQPLERRLAGLSLHLLETLIRLRALLRLAADSGRLTAGGYRQVLERVDGIGRQLGAWQSSEGPV